MTKITVEFPEKGGWRRVTTDLKRSTRSNWYFKVDDQVYVAGDRKAGTPILRKTGREWVQAGRIGQYRAFFIGPSDAQTYREYLNSPQGRENSRKLLESIMNKRLK